MTSYDSGFRSERTNYKRGDREHYSQIVSDQLASKKYQEAAMAKLKEFKIREAEEQKYSKQLLALGKLCAYREAFDGISLENQNISPVGPFEDPRKSESFQIGYDAAQPFIKIGLSEESYHDFENNYENEFETKEQNNKRSR